MAIYVARRSTPIEFGAFSLAFATYIFLLGICRALVLTPLVVRRSADIDKRTDRALVQAVTSASLLIGVALGSLLLASSLLFGGAYRLTLLAIAVSLPILLWQDAFRFVAIAAGRPRDAFVVDGLWLGGALALVPVLTAVTGWGAWWQLGLWGLSAGFGVIGGCWLWGVRAEGRGSLRWVRTNADLGVRYVGEFLTSMGITQALIFVVAFFGGAVAAGGLQGARTALGPVSLVLTSMMLFLVPETVRIARQQPERVAALAVGASAMFVAIPLVWTLAFSLLNASVGEALFGASWESIREMLPAVGLLTSMSGLLAGPTLALRAFADARSSLRLRLLAGPLVLILAIAGCAVFSIRSGLMLAAAGYVIVLPYSVHLVRRATRIATLLELELEVRGE